MASISESAGEKATVFARAGYVTLCIDMPVFGKRATVSEGSASKALLWYGKGLFGQMLNHWAATDLGYQSGIHSPNSAGQGPNRELACAG